eukprot:350256_1
MSKKEKFTVGLLSASVGLAALGVAIKMMKQKDPKPHSIDQIESTDYPDDEADEFKSKRKGSDNSMISSTNYLDAFNSSRLNEADTDAFNSSISHLHDLSTAKLLPDGVRFLDYFRVLKLIRSKDRNYMIFDLRGIDYLGGHLANSVHIPDTSFYDQIPMILQKNHGVSMVMFQCMDGSLRSVENVEYLAKARKELIKNYDEATKTSYYYQYKLKVQHDAHKTVLRSINWESEGWMKRFVEKKKVEIDFSLHEDMFRNVRNQKLFVIAGGFFEFMNSLISHTKIAINSMEWHKLISDFDMAQWEELSVMGEKKLYHRKEYYTTRRINPLRKTMTKREF